MIVERIHRKHIVVHHLPRKGDDGDTQIVERLLVGGNVCLVLLAVLFYRFQQMPVLELELQAQIVRLVLLFTQILESDEAQDDTPRESNQHHKEPAMEGKFNRGSHSQNLNGLLYTIRTDQSWSADG